MVSQLQADGKPTVDRQIAIRTLQKDYLARIVYFYVRGSPGLSKPFGAGIRCRATGYKISCLDGLKLCWPHKSPGFQLDPRIIQFWV